jgi:RHS repeat-associated protein
MDNTGSARGTAIYHAYGKPTLTGEIPTFAYAGMFYHQASGLYLTQYRAYDSNFGRWISRDPVGEVSDGNLYAYVNDEPSSSIDPRGLVAWGWHPVAGVGGHEFLVLDNGDTISFQPIAPNGEIAGPADVLSLNATLGFRPNSDAGCAESGPIPPPPGMTEQQFNDALLAAAKSYNGKLRYDWSPGGNFYNSNSAISGLLQAVGAQQPDTNTFAPNHWFPGADHPIPGQYFTFPAP